MDIKEIEKYKIRDYYMIPVEVVDNMFYLFEQQCRKQKEVIDKIFSRITLLKMEDITMKTNKVLDELLDILKEVSK